VHGDAGRASQSAARGWAHWRSLSWPEAGALTLILALSAGLNLTALNQEGFGNTYYAAAVWSMLQNWHAFLFASFDAGGFVTVDKPPLGLWAQVLSARLLGFNGLAILLPQALAGVASVLLVYVLVRRAFGVVAACAAALVLTVTPISVVTDRNNTMDSILVLTLLLAVFAVSLAAERGSFGWLLVGAALVGAGFNVKMLQAYPVVPGLALAYLVSAPVKWRRRLADLTLALVVLIGVSLSWSIFVDLTPADLRPYIGSSGNNSALSLALGYNGLSRITLAIAQHVPALSFLGTNIDLQVAPIMAPGIGNPGLLRLLAPTLAGQVSWLLIFACVGVVAGALGLVLLRKQHDTDDSTDERRRTVIALIVWGGWLLVWSTIFSFARFYHVYYLTMLGPAVAALTGIGLVCLWRIYRDPLGGLGRWLLPAALLVSLWAELGVVSLAPSVRGWLTPLLVGGTLVAIAALLLEYALDLRHVQVARGAVALGMAALLVAPLTWSLISVQDGNGGGWLVEAGPNVGGGSFGGPGGGRGGPPAGQAPGGRGAGRGFSGGNPPAFGAGGAPFGFGGGGNGALTFAGTDWNHLDPALVSYLEANQGADQYLVATTTSSYASLFILDSGQPAMALGGYQGWDRVLTPDLLAQQVADGVVRFFYVPPPRSGGSRQVTSSSLDGTSDLVTWVSNHCSVVQDGGWQSTGGLQLYDCQA
jgi:4-amino-4-deoxy-L-arabinose transferase-like glycosyltransferase